MIIPLLVSKYPIISDQIQKPALQVVLRELESVLTGGVDGDVVEFGCYIGTTSLFIRRMLDHYKQSVIRGFHVYDSFAGLPPKTFQDLSAVGADFKAGELSVSKKQLVQEFHKAGLIPPLIHKAWFDQLTDADTPGSIAFAFLDGDFYSSIITSLRLVWPRLAPGGIITVDDYQRETLPGVEQAITDFFQDKQAKQISLHHEHNIAIIKRI